MGRPLFQIEDDLIDSLCFGFSDRDTELRFVEAFEEGRQAMQNSVRARMRAVEFLEDYADETVVKLVGGDFVVILPEEIEDDALALEYGDGEDRPQPVLRPGVQEARGVAEMTINRWLDMP